jgi:general stress protein YciG
MAGNTEESARFKKAFQTVGGGDNNKTLDKNFNDEMFKEAGATTEANLNNDTKSADSAIERDLETKVRSSD